MEQKSKKDLIKNIYTSNKLLLKQIKHHEKNLKKDFYSDAFMNSSLFFITFHEYIKEFFSPKGDELMRKKVEYLKEIGAIKEL